MRSLHTKEKYLLGIVAFLALLLVIRSNFNSVIAPIFANSGEMVAQKKELYRKYLAILNNKEQIEKAYQKNKDVIESMEKKIFTGKDVNVAITRLQKSIQDIAEQSNINIKRIQTLKPEKVSDRLHAINLRIFAQSHTVKNLNTFLNQLEFNNQKLIYIPKLYTKKIRSELHIELEVFSLSVT